jgi:hypothetical protein
MVIAPGTIAIAIPMNPIGIFQTFENVSMTLASINNNPAN